MRLDTLKRVKGYRRQANPRAAERSARIRTYNFPEQRVTDHRVGLTLPLRAVLDGDLDAFVAALESRL